MAEQKQKSQFMHLELYSRTGTTQGKTSTGGVINETLRVEGFTDHIIADGFKPVAPTYLYSQDDKTLDEHYQLILDQVATEKDNLGRKIKSDKNILLAGVVSYPKPRVADWSIDDQQTYELFKQQTLDFLKKKFGDNLLCVIEHTDEQYPHCHFYIANKQRVASTPELHPGQAENIRLEQEAKAQGKPVNKKEQTTAYREAMRQFQDDFFNQVSIYCGLDRLGPKAQRLNRKEWKERKRVVKQLAKAYKKVKSEALDISDKSKNLNQSLLELEQQISQVMDMQTQLEAEQKAIEQGVIDLELAKFVREHHKELVAKFNIQRLRSNSNHTSNKLKIV